MTLLPIVDRELRVRARQKITHRFRVGSAFTAMVLVVFMLFMAAASSPQAIGQPMFHVLSWLAFAYCLLEGARTTADCLSEEKRNGTLGLLFLTDLKGYDVVLGKFFASSLNSFYALLAILPPLALPILIGGVTGAEFWRLVLMLLTTLFFSLCTGMLISSVSQVERRALGSTLAVLAAITLTPLILLWNAPKPIAWMRSLSPAIGFRNVFESSYTLDPEIFTLSVWLLNVLSIVMLAVASAILPRVWQQREVRSGRTWIEALSARIATARSGGANHRQRWLLNVNPVLWLAVLQQPSVRFLWMIVSGVGVAGLASWLLVLAYRPASPSLMASVTSSLLLMGLMAHLTMAICVITSACHFFADARSSGALELLLCTPLSVTQMVEGHRSALKRLFGPPIITLVVIEFLVGFGHVLFSQDSSGGGGVVIVGALAVCLPILMLDLYAAAEYGLWLGLNSKKSTHAVTKTALYVIILPSFSLFCCWPVFSIIKDLILINIARDQLRRRFRAVVTERFTEADKPEEPLFRMPAKARPRLPSVLPRH